MDALKWHKISLVWTGLFFVGALIPFISGFGYMGVASYFFVPVYLLILLYPGVVLFTLYKKKRIGYIIAIIGQVLELILLIGIPLYLSILPENMPTILLFLPIIALLVLLSIGYIFVLYKSRKVLN